MASTTHVDSASRGRPHYSESQRDNPRGGGFPHVNEDRDNHVYREMEPNRNGYESSYPQSNTWRMNNVYRKAISPEYGDQDGRP